MNNKSIAFAALLTIVGFTTPVFADPVEEVQTPPPGQEEPITPETICDFEPACTIEWLCRIKKAADAAFFVGKNLEL